MPEDYHRWRDREERRPNSLSHKRVSFPRQLLKHGHRSHRDQHVRSRSRSREHRRHNEEYRGKYEPKQSSKNDRFDSRSNTNTSMQIADPLTGLSIQQRDILNDIKRQEVAQAAKLMPYANIDTERWEKGYSGDLALRASKKHHPDYTGVTTANPLMIEVVVNDRLGTKESIKCYPNDTVGTLKKLVSAKTGTRPDKIILQHGSHIYRDHITLDDYEIKDGTGLEMYYQ